MREKWTTALLLMILINNQQDESPSNKRASIYSKSSLMSSNKVINMFSQQSIDSCSNKMSKTSKQFYKSGFRNRSLPPQIQNFKKKREGSITPIVSIPNFDNISIEKESYSPAIQK